MAKRIAMILIIVIIINCFTSCTREAGAGFGAEFGKALLIPLCIVAVGSILYAFITFPSSSKSKAPRRANPYLFEEGKLIDTVKSMPQEELDSMTRAFYSLPDKELNLFVGRLNSMSKQETVSVVDSINAFSEEELAAIVKTIISMEETELVFQLEHLNSMPKTVSLAEIINSADVNAYVEKESAGQSLRN